MCRHRGKSLRLRSSPNILNHQVPNIACSIRSSSRVVDACRSPPRLFISGEFFFFEHFSQVSAFLSGQVELFFGGADQGELIWGFGATEETAASGPGQISGRMKRVVG